LTLGDIESCWGPCFACPRDQEFGHPINRIYPRIPCGIKVALQALGLLHKAASAALDVVDVRGKIVPLIGTKKSTNDPVVAPEDGPWRPFASCM
jgi:hypothetical protein